MITRVKTLTFERLHQSVLVLFLVFSLGISFVLSQAQAQETSGVTNDREETRITGKPEPTEKFSTFDRAKNFLTNDPLSKFCADIGKPLTAPDLEVFSGAEFLGVIDGIQAFREVAGEFVSSQTRSVRYLPGKQRTAQFLIQRDRHLCIHMPGNNIPTCAIALECNSEEADFILLDDNDQVFALANISRPTDRSLPPPEEGHDWVEFAGGSARLEIRDEEPISSYSTKTKYAQLETKCSIGAGHPEIDNAFAYTWFGGSCNNRIASGRGEVHFIAKDGTIASVPMGAGTGLLTRNGKLYWDFPETAFLLRVVCSAEDDEIPRKQEEVEKVNFIIDVPAAVNIGEKAVYEKVASVALPYGEKICGVKFNDVFVSVDFRSGPNEKRSSLLSLKYTQPRFVPIDSSARSLASEKYRDQRAGQNSKLIFARFIREFAEDQRIQELNSFLKKERHLNNIANGIRSVEIPTLIALANGIYTKMAWSNPEFSNSEFSVSWRVQSTDPVEEFLSKRSNFPSWQSLRNTIPVSNLRANMRITCKVPAKDADEFTPNRYVRTYAKLLSYSSGNMVLQCSSP